MDTPLEPVYSPSQTRVWDACPVLRQLERQGYRSSTYGKKEIAGAMGRGLAAGLGTYYIARLHSEAVTLNASLALQAELNELTAMGRVCDNREIELLQQAPAKLLRVLAKTISLEPIPLTWSIEDVEFTLPDHGHARLDLAVRDPHSLAIVDWKLKLNLAKGWQRDKTIREYAHDTQMFHYCWAYGEVKQQPVTRFYIGLVVLEPTFSVELIPYEIEPEAMQMWLVSARQKWADMAAEDAGERVPYQASVHFDRYGQCPMYKACFGHKYHEHLMLQSGDYVKKEKV